MFHGLLLVDKPIFFTSHDVVDVVRRATGQRRVGHAGTLDPMATGLLVLMLGSCTSLFDALSGHDKTYDGVMTLGFATATQDTEGSITALSDSSWVTGEDVVRAYSRLTGVIEQKAPLYSAVKKNGRKAYEAARKGKGDGFELPTRSVEVHELRLNAFENPDAYFSCRVSRGTYIRSLASDVGSQIGVPATLTSLRRTSCGVFDLREAIGLGELARSTHDALSAQITANHQKFLDHAATPVHAKGLTAREDHN